MRYITRAPSPTLRVSPGSSSAAGQQSRLTGHRRQDQHGPRETPKVGTARPASVGAVLGAKPELSFGLSWLPDAFDRVWVLALSGHLKFAHVDFTKPHFNSGLVVSASFSDELRSTGCVHHVRALGPESERERPHAGIARHQC